MTESYRKDMSHTTWDKVYRRQLQRADLSAEWLDALALQPGDHVLDIGSGPGHISLLAAARVGPTGQVYAVDRAAAALDYLATLQQEQGVPQIHRITSDAADPALAAALSSQRIDAALVTMMLHHADDPADLIASVARLLPPGSRAVVAEYDPRGPGEVGPPCDQRIPPDQVRSWCEASGLQVESYRQQSPEHYLWLVRRTGAAAASTDAHA